ncbi:glucose-6-phosphate isomerase [Canibacter zhoujuaniae]|uniref:glucose-6-phosphate isomerase n=1 Tax=Canibacter zhoujuaniae TaxID=2708343 RepID=UPI001422FABF|nr:glucose-6-phosphate isomerase [Canibacter zhoujuaniae]
MAKFRVFTPDKDSSYRAALQLLVDKGFAGRLQQQDATLWLAQDRAEAAERMGWVAFQEAADETLARAAEHRAKLRDLGCERIVLCGVGGSSLAAALIADWENVELTVLDSTHPAQVAEVLAADLHHTAVIIASKSGTTLETQAQLQSFEQAYAAAGISARERVTVITDPATPLESHATQHGYTIFNADPKVGGRFSALTAFGLVPPTLAGAELGPLLVDANAAVAKLFADSAENPALQLAAALFSRIKTEFAGYVIPTADEATQLGDWIEQLVAESTGKHGKGFLPIGIPFEQVTDLDLKAAHTTTVYVPEEPDAAQTRGYAVSGNLAEQFLTWEIATAALGWLLEINPFNQPDVEAAKSAARQIIESTEPPSISCSDSENLNAADISTAIATADYVALNVYAPQNEHSRALLEPLRAQLMATAQAPVALNYGPRYLHSTGQFHKGSAKRGFFISLLALAAPENSATTAGSVTAATAAQSGERNTTEPDYAKIIAAQASGDAKVLRERGHRVLELSGADLAQLVSQVAAVISH